MKDTLLSKIRVIVYYVVICLVSAGVTFIITKKVELQSVRKEAQERLTLLGRYIEANIGRYGVYARILSENPLIVDLCRNPDNDTLEATNKYLSKFFNDSVGAAVTFIINKDGMAISSSNYQSRESFVGIDYNFRQYFKKAIQGQPNSFIAIGVRTYLPGYFTAYPIKHGDETIGVFVIKYALNIFQTKDFQLDGILLLADGNDVIFASNDDRFLFHTIGELPAETLRQIKDSKQYLSEPLPPLPMALSKGKDNATIVTMRWNDTETHKTKDVDYILEEMRNPKNDWHLHLLVDMSRVNDRIVYNIEFVISLVTVTFLIVILIAHMALDIKRRKQYEQSIEAANEELERKVTMRTQQLEGKIERQLVLEKWLVESEKKYRQLVELSKEGVWAIDNAGVTTYVNQAVADMLGYTVEEMTGVQAMAFMDDDAREKADKIFSSHRETGTSDRIEHSFLNKNGGVVHVSVSFASITDDQGNYTGSFAVVSDITRRKETEQKLVESLAEQELLLRELHHRVKNNLQIISGLVGLQISHVTDEGYKNILKDTQSRIQSIALVHEKLYNAEKLSRISIQGYIVGLVEGLIDFFMVDKGRFVVNFDVTDMFVGIDTAIPCGLIVNELFTNIIKYAFTGRESGAITIELHEAGQDELEIVVGDDGIGMPEGIEPGKTKSLGLKVVSVLTKQLKGTIEMERGAGTKFRLRFKK